MRDEKFIDGFIKNYNNSHKDVKNLYYVIIDGKGQTLNHVTSKNVVPIHLNIKTWIKILKNKEIKNIYLHNFPDHFFAFINFIPKRISLFWIFYGYEIYENVLLLKILDENSRNIYLEASKAKYLLPIFPKKIIESLLIIRERYRIYKLRIILSKIDYFCHWNRLDYEALKKYFPEFKASFMPFSYASSQSWLIQDLINDEKKQSQPNKNIIMVGNCAKITLNHLTILKHLQQFDQSLFSIICPLNYGDKEYKEFLIEYANKNHLDNFEKLDIFLSLSEYFKFMSKISVLVMNNYRTQGSGNISLALKFGKKVYMNPINTHFTYLKEYGFIVHSVEEFLKSPIEEILTPLTEAQKEQNQNLIRDIQVNGSKRYHNLP